MVEENRYRQLFIDKFKVNETQLDSEFARIVDEFEYSEQIKMKFYCTVFETVIVQFKNEVPKDENYHSVITAFYTFFIDALDEDNLDSSKYKEDLEKFNSDQKPSSSAAMKDESNHQPEYKEYNLNTKYGRRKAREQAYRNYENGTPEYRRDIDSMRIVVWVIVLVIAAVVFVVKYSVDSGPC